VCEYVSVGSCVCVCAAFICQQMLLACVEDFRAPLHLALFLLIFSPITLTSTRSGHAHAADDPTAGPACGGRSICFARGGRLFDSERVADADADVACGAQPARPG
jgi:hypothetical protein